jgi:hypothetical protein
VPPGIWMLALRTWHLWANDRERLWMNSWNMSIGFADRLTSKTISRSSKLGSNEGLSLRLWHKYKKPRASHLLYEARPHLAAIGCSGRDGLRAVPNLIPHKNKIFVTERLSLSLTPTRRYVDTTGYDESRLRNKLFPKQLRWQVPRP